MLGSALIELKEPTFREGGSALTVMLDYTWTRYKGTGSHSRRCINQTPRLLLFIHCCCLASKFDCVYKKKSWELGAWEWIHSSHWKFPKLCPHSPAPSTVQIPSSSLHNAHLGRNHAHKCVPRPSPFRLDGWGEKMWASIRQFGGWSTMLMILKVDIPIPQSLIQGYMAYQDSFVLFFFFSFALY